MMTRAFIWSLGLAIGLAIGFMLLTAISAFPSEMQGAVGFLIGCLVTWLVDEEIRKNTP